MSVTFLPIVERAAPKSTGMQLTVNPAEDPNFMSKPSQRRINVAP